GVRSRRNALARTRDCGWRDVGRSLAGGGQDLPPAPSDAARCTANRLTGRRSRPFARTCCCTRQQTPVRSDERVLAPRHNNAAYGFTLVALSLGATTGRFPRWNVV